MQVFVVPPVGPEGSKTIHGLDSTTTVGFLRRELLKGFQENACLYEEMLRDMRLSHSGRPLLNDNALLSDEGIVHGSIIRTSVRLRGGSMIKLKARTSFGCSCFVGCFCKACLTGRVYDIQVNNIDNGSVLQEAVAAQNPSYKQAKYKGQFITSRGVIIEPDRKLIVYDLDDGDDVHLQVLPWYWFKKNYRGQAFKDTLRDDDDDDEEYKAALERLRRKKEAEAMSRETA